MTNAYKILPILILSLSIFYDAQSQIVVEEDKYEEFILDGKLYKPYANYLTLGVGKGTNFKPDEKLHIGDSLIHSFYGVENNITLDFHFRIKDYWLIAGYHHSSEEFFLYRPPIRLDELYLGAGYALDEEKYHFSAYLAPSYGLGNYYNPIPVTDSVGNITKYYLFTSYRDLGLHVKVEYTRKIYYDLGIGITAYATINKHYPLLGIQLHVFFSGAFKGYIE